MSQRKLIIAESIKPCSTEEKKELLLTLNENINQVTNDYVELDANNFVQYVPHIGVDDDLLNKISDEVEKLNLKSRSASAKVKTQWLSHHNHSYDFGHEKHDPKPLSDFPAIASLMGLVNQQDSTSKDMDSCLVSCYSSKKSILRPHADDEDQIIDQNSSICSFSVGTPRTIEFLKKPKKHTKKGNIKTSKPVLSIKMEHASLTVMKPGCQQLLLHQVLAGELSDDDNVIRYSLSFRKTITPVDDVSQDIEDKHPASSTSPSNVKEATPPASPSKMPDRQIPPPRKVTLIAGDSYSARLDDRLGKNNKKKIVNISKGGNTIADVEKSLDEFYIAQSNVLVEKVFVCVGTNDLNKCHENGSLHLKTPLNSYARR